MAKILYCRDAGFDCDAVVHGDSEQDVLDQVGPHVEQVHGQRLDTATADQLRPLIRSEG
ncbi:DUF1059 domain-containing protein [Ornithinicoccus halotolerans]|uniref:DUF1059 domain-containing protein n=1 Tax=Ornithinicoccus halotolerans TaxID=1748220 RepID=UPI0012962A55|nr:DUF1059 domain-containing protein [Ornithinicoccus halotolerans]